MLTPAVYDFFRAPLRARFDIVTWDPRGIGESTAVQCFASQQAEERFLDGVGEPTESFPVGKAEKIEWNQRYRRFGSRCERRNGNLLRHLSTAAIARDMNLLRRAAGAGRLNYWGVSYGSFLGATYANLFPKRVRAMILDGDVNPRAWVRRQEKANGGRFLGTWLRQRSDQGTAKTLDAFLRLCGQSDSADCAFSAGSPAATQDKFAALLRRLRRAPETAEPTYAELVSQTASILYSVGHWAVLAQWLQDAWTNGSSSRPLEPSSLPPGTPARRSSGGAGQRYAGIEQALAIFCSESPNPRPAAFWGLDSFAEARSGSVGPFWSWASQPCASWPAKAATRYAGPWNRRTANPLLVIGNTHDPATPYRGARTMARLLARARLLTVDGYGHTALTNPSACANAHASRYLIQRALPRTGARCEQDQAPFGG